MAHGWDFRPDTGELLGMAAFYGHHALDWLMRYPLQERTRPLHQAPGPDLARAGNPGEKSSFSRFRGCAQLLPKL